MLAPWVRQLAPLLVLVIVTGTLLPAGREAAATGPKYTAPGSIATHNTELVGHVDTPSSATSLAFTSYSGPGRGGVLSDVMFAVGEFGLRAYSLKHPHRPRLMGEVTNCELALSIDNCHTGNYWEGGAFVVDPDRKLVFLPRDPRSFNGSLETGTSGIYVVDVADPRHMEVVTFHPLPAGHTTRCVQFSDTGSCEFLWTQGPFGTGTGVQPASWRGLPARATNVRIPDAPYTLPDPIDLRRNDGVTDYVHSTVLDARGVAWTSGAGGVRGYWVSGRHYDPRQQRTRKATPWSPIPYAGGKFVQKPDIGYPGGDFVHNSWHPLRSFPGFDSGEIIFAAIENFTEGCKTDGHLAAVSLEGSYDGQGWWGVSPDPFRLEIVGQWGPAGKAGSTDTNNCSSHWFDPAPDGSDLLVQAFYAQGTRFIDVSNPREMKQVGYFVPSNGVPSSVFWHDGLVYIADYNRGIDIIRYTGPHPN